MPPAIGRVKFFGRQGMAPKVFEKTVLRRSQIGQGLSLGEIAEALLFYQNVHLVLDVQSLGGLVKSLGASELSALLERRRLTAVYAEDMLATNNESRGSLQIHSFVTATISGKKNGETMLRSRRERLQYMLELMQLSGGDARRLADRFLKMVPVTRYSGDVFVTGGVHKSAAADLTDLNYVTAAFRRMLREQVGFEAYAERLRVEVTKLSAEQFTLSHNIDFVKGNTRRKEVNPTLESLTEGNLLAALLDANADLNIASHYGGDFYTSATNSDIVRIRYAEVLKRTGRSMEQLKQFQDIVLRGYPTIREAIDSGTRSFSDFERLLEKSDRFRETVHKIGPDASLVAEYFGEVSKEGWISSLPVKVIRYVIGLTVGTASPAAGAALSAADTFILDKLKGWRPNHFVDDKLKPFLES
jgi:hypothetical protein